MSWQSIKTNIQNRGFRDILNPLKWVIYVRDLLRKEDGFVNIPYDDAVAYSEQLIYRMSQCPQCVKAGKCIGDGSPGAGCGCLLPNAMLDQLNYCSEGAWGQMLPTAEWEQEKEAQNLKVILKYD